MANEFVVRNGLIVSGSTYLEAISQSNEAYILSYDSVTNEVAYMPTSSVVVTVPGSDTQIIYNNGGVFGASSNLVFSGSRVGIGSANPAYTLDVVGAVNASGGFRTSDNVFTNYIRDTSGVKYISLDGTGIKLEPAGYGQTVLQAVSTGVNITGNVGIGTTNPSSRLTVAGEGSGSVRMGNTGFGGDWVGISLSGNLNTTDYNLLGSQSNTSFYLNRPNGGDMLFRHNNVDQMIIKSGGNVGIGSTNPSYKLDVNGGSASSPFRVISTNTTSLRTFLEATSGNVEQHFLYTGNQDWVLGLDKADSNKFKLASADDGFASAKLTVTTGGSVGIGTTNPLGLFEVKGDGVSYFTRGTKSLLLNPNVVGQDTNALIDTSTGMALAFATAGTERMRILTGGNVGIGTADPLYKLHVGSGDILANQVYAKVSLGIQSASGDVHVGASGDGGPATGSQDYGYYIAHNAYRASTGAWVHSRTGTIPAVRHLGSAGVSGGTSGFYWDFSDNVGTGAINWTNLMRLTTGGNLGIGLTDPTHKLTVLGAVSASSFTGSFSGTTTNAISASYAATASSADAFHIRSTATVGSNFQIDSNGDFYQKTTGGAAIWSAVGNSTYPSYAFYSDLGLGMYRGAEDTLSFATSGSERVRITSDGNLAINSTSTSGYRLYVNGSTWINGGTNFVDGVTILRTESGASEVMRIASGGNVGIGTTNPLYKLHVVGSTYVNSGTLFVDSGEYIRWGNSAQGIRGVNDTSLEFVVGSSTRMYVSSSGNLGVGTTAPATGLHVRGAANGIDAGNVRIDSTSEFGGLVINENTTFRTLLGYGNSGNIFSNAQTDSTALRAANYLHLGASSAATITINGGNDNVGIGTTNPLTKLQVNKSSQAYTSPTASGALVLSDTGGTGAVLDMGVNTTYLSYIQSRYLDSTTAYQLLLNPGGGSVGIGTTAPTAKLDVNGDTLVTGSVKIAAGGGGAFELWDVGVQRAYIGMTGTPGLNLASDAEIQFQPGNATAVTFASSGNVGIGTTSPSSKLDVSVTPSAAWMNLINANETAFRLTTYNNGTNNGSSIYAFKHGLYYNTTENAAVTFYRGGSSVGGFLTFTTDNGAERMRIATDGNVGIGITNPSYKLHVSGGNSYMDGDLTVTGAITAQELYVEYISSSIIYSTGSNKFGDQTSDNHFFTGSILQSGSLAYFAGSVGIGTASPGEVLEVVGNIRANVSNGGGFMLTGASASGLVRAGATGLALRTDTADRLTIDINGNVGIGTTNPTSKLTVNGDTTITGSLYITDGVNGDNLRIYQDSDGSFRFSNSAIGTFLDVGNTNAVEIVGQQLRSVDRGAYFDSNVLNTAPLQVGTSGLYVQSGSYNVGIGTTTPSTTLDVNGRAIVGGGLSGNALSISTSVGTYTFNGYDLLTPSSFIITAGSSGYLALDGYPVIFKVSGGEKMRVNTDGNVGIGTNAPTAKLQITGSSGNAVSISRAGGYASIYGDNDIVFETNTAFYFGAYAAKPVYINGVNGQAGQVQVSSDGNLGIGVANIGAKLAINGNIAFSGSDGETTGIYVKSAGNITEIPSGLFTFTKVSNYGSTAKMSTGRGGGGWETNGAVMTFVAGASDDLVGYPSQSQHITFNTTGSSPSYSSVVYIDRGFGGTRPSLHTHNGAAFAISTGSVGIGTTSPSYKLDVNGDGRFTGGLNLTSENPQLTFTDTTAGEDDMVLSMNGDYLEFLSNALRNIITVHGETSAYAGRVGIGTTSPGQKLQIDSPLQTEYYGTDNASPADAMNIVGTGAFRGLGTGSALLFSVPANTDGSNMWAQARILGTGDNASNGNAEGAMFLQTRALYNPGVGGSWNWRTNMVLRASGNVGIGTTNPAEKLHIYGTSNQVVKIENSGTYLMYLGLVSNEGFIGSTNATPLTFYTNNVNRMYITTAGKVGVGTTNPGALFQIKDGERAKAIFRIASTATASFYTGSFIVNSDDGGADGMLYGSIPGGSFPFDGYGETILQGNARTGYNSGISLVTGEGTSPAVRMRINASGNVGIGTTNPAFPLQLNSTVGSGGMMSLLNTSGTESSISYRVSNGAAATGWVVGNSANDYFLYSYTFAGQVATFKPSGNVGIGTTNPTNKLEVLGSATIRNSNGGGALNIGTNSGRTEYQYVTLGGGTGGTDYGWQVGRSPQTGGVINDGFYIYDIKTNNAPFAIRLGGDVGIGTTNPGTKLNLKESNTGTEGFIITNWNGVNTLLLGSDSSSGGGKITLRTNAGTSNVFISSYSDSYLNGGNVGIGTTNPGTKLQLTDGNILVATLSSSNNVTLQYAPGNVNGQIRGQIIFDTPGSEPSYVNANDAYKWKIATVGSLGTGPAYYNSDLNFLRTTRLGITDSAVMTLSGFTGNVGIGTTNPSARLDIDGQIQIGGASATPNVSYGMFAYSGVGLGIYSGAGSSTQGIGIWMNNGSPYEAIRILSGGNVGIGTTNPSSTLEVYSSANANTVTITSDGANEQFRIRRYTNTNEQLILGFHSSDYGYIQSVEQAVAYRPLALNPFGGNVGIGTTNPSQRLSVYGDIAIANSASIQETRIGKYQSGSLGSGTHTIASVSVTNVDAVFFDYVIKNSTTDMRAGTVMAVTNGSTVEYTDISTADIGDTTRITMISDVSGGNIRLRASIDTGAGSWTVRTLIRTI